MKSRRVGGATFQVPTEIAPDRKESICMKNLILYARKRGGKTMADKLGEKSQMHTTIKEAHSKEKKICIEWLKLTVHSLISDSNKKEELKNNGKG